MKKKLILPTLALTLSGVNNAFADNTKFFVGASIGAQSTSYKSTINKDAFKQQETGGETQQTEKETINQIANLFKQTDKNNILNEAFAQALSDALQNTNKDVTNKDVQTIADLLGLSSSSRKDDIKSALDTLGDKLNNAFNEYEGNILALNNLMKALNLNKDKPQEGATFIFDNQNKGSGNYATLKNDTEKYAATIGNINNNPTKQELLQALFSEAWDLSVTSTQTVIDGWSIVDGSDKDLTNTLLSAIIQNDNFNKQIFNLNPNLQQIITTNEEPLSTAISLAMIQVLPISTINNQNGNQNVTITFNQNNKTITITQTPTPQGSDVTFDVQYDNFDNAPTKPNINTNQPVQSFQNALEAASINIEIDTNSLNFDIISHIQTSHTTIDIDNDLTKENWEKQYFLQESFTIRKQDIKKFNTAFKQLNINPNQLRNIKNVLDEASLNNKISKISPIISAFGGVRVDSGDFAFTTELGIDYAIGNKIGNQSKNEIELKNSLSFFANQKVGYKFTQNSLTYILGGLSYGSYDAKLTAQNIDQKFSVLSFVLGAGYEFKILENLNMFAEVNTSFSGKNYIKFNGKSKGIEMKISTTQVKIGARYYFD